MYRIYTYNEDPQTDLRSLLVYKKLTNESHTLTNYAVTRKPKHVSDIVCNLKMCMLRLKHGLSIISSNKNIIMIKDLFLRHKARSSGLVYNNFIIFIDSVLNST